MADRVNYLAGPEMRATPQKNALAGRVSNAIRAVDEFARKPFGYDNPPAAMLSDALSVPAIYRTLDRIAYGEPLTTGAGQATKLRPDTVETAFTIGPSIIKWPKQVGGAIAAIAGGGVGTDDAVRAATVWHGTPHKFDKFDSSKIGTGEGAQAYGHGLYFAEAPTVAEGYKNRLTMDRGFNFGGKSGLTREQVQDLVNAREGAGFLDGVSRPSGVADQVIDSIVYGKNGELPRGYKEGSQRAELYKKLLNEIQHNDSGSLYKVDLPDPLIARMLDWDKPLSQQSKEVQSALDRVGFRGGDKTGQEIYKTISGFDKAANIASAAIKGGQDAADTLRLFLPGITDHQIKQAIAKASQSGSAGIASQVLRDAGIPGVRYLDGGSRGAGGGTSNFVVFPNEEGALTILERNGQPVNALSRK